MGPLVIVHGAFGGGWEWTPVAEALRFGGIRVFTPTLSGLGDRYHLDPASVGMATHVADIVGVLEMEDLRDVTMCAASYGGMPVTAAAARLEDRLARLVYLDALVPRDGEAVVDLLPGRAGEDIRDGWREHGPAHRVPVPELVLPPVGSAPESVRRSYVDRLRPQPVRTFVEPARVVDNAVPTTFVRCVASTLAAEEDPITAMAARARARGWDYRELEAGHDPHLSNPTEVVALLREVAAQSPTRS